MGSSVLVFWSSIHACPAHLIHLYWIALIILREK
jgi:hypothetical protein